jgi:V/A-type H+-transporting ATPase subunit E
MSGLDKMKSQILNDANQTAEAKISGARKEEERILAQARADAEAQAQQSEQKAKTAVENYAQRIASSCDMQRRKALLEAKQEIISGVLEKAYDKVVGLPEEAYFDMVSRMLEKYVQSGTGEIYFSAADLKRMPQGFDKKIQRIAAANGGALTVSAEPKAMDGGFILVYGGIEENCTIRAMFDAKHDELSDQVQKMMF